MSLYPHQQRAMEKLRANWLRGIRKNLLVASTGWGKTHFFSHALAKCAEKGNRAVMVVRGRQLVDQASRRLFHENISHGVQMASHWNKNHSAMIQICSIDTLLSRSKFPEASLVVVDEAHLFTSASCVEFMEHYNKAFILGVTATPWTRDSLRHIADAVIEEGSMRELIDGGYLMPARYFAPSAPDLKGVRTSGDDWIQDDLEERMNKLTGDIVGHWKRIGEGRPTLGFAVNIKHAAELTEQCNVSGIPAEFITGEHSFAERSASFDRLRKAEKKILWNVGTCTTGVDLPFVSCILMARPTKSYNLYIQIAGRGTRPHPESGKKDFLILDHSSNVMRHGFITDTPEATIDGATRFTRDVAAKVCEECYAVYTGTKCHACGNEPPATPRFEPETVDGILEELKELPIGIEASIFIRRLKSKFNGCNKEFLHAKVAEKYGVDVADTAFGGRKRPRFLQQKQNYAWK